MYQNNFFLNFYTVATLPPNPPLGATISLIRHSITCIWHRITAPVYFLIRPVPCLESSAFCQPPRGHKKGTFLGPLSKTSISGY